MTDAGIANGAAIAFSVASRNDFYAGPHDLEPERRGAACRRAPRRAPGVAPVATPGTDGRHDARR